MKERFSKIVHKHTKTPIHEAGNIHSHVDHHPIVSRLWQKATVAGTLAVGLAEVAAGRSSSAVLIDGIHNVIDSGTLGLQAESAHSQTISPGQRKRRKIVHTVIAGTSVAVAVKAGIDLGLGSEISQNPIGIYTAGTSFALNTALGVPLLRNYWRKRREGTIDHHDRDLVKHMVLMDLPSAVLAFGSELVRQRYGIAEPISAIASGLIGAVIFRPTRKNLDHSHCPKHSDPEHIDRDPLQGVSQQKDPLSKSRKKRVLKKITAVTAAATLLGGGIFLGVKGDISPKTDFHSSTAAGSIVSHGENIDHQKSTKGKKVFISQKKPPPVQQKRNVALSEIKKIVYPGDTVWGMEKEILYNAGCRTTDTEIANRLPSIQEVNAFAINRIYPNETVIFPSQSCIVSV